MPGPLLPNILTTKNEQDFYANSIKMKFLPTTTPTSTHVKGTPAAYRSPKAVYPSGQASGVPRWLFLFLLLSFGSLQVMAQMETVPTYPIGSEPTVVSDKDDYLPGEIAIITGTGWTLDQQVDVHFEETPAFHEEHQHDYHGIAVDENGNWRIDYPIEERHRGVHFTVHVVGKQTSYEA